MAPTALQAESAPKTYEFPKSKLATCPLKSTGSIDSFKQIILTPIIGTEYPETNIVDEILNASNAEQRIRDLAIKSRSITGKGVWASTNSRVPVSERGVVFFRKQDNLTNDLQKKLILRLGELTCRPATNSLHIHPVFNDNRELGGTDAEISNISSVQRNVLYKDSDYSRMAAVWHSDISFEREPADYSSLRLTQLPESGGDTLWASGYEMYDRISKPYQKFLETLTATHIGSTFHQMAATGKFELYTEPRGSPKNAGTALAASHPVCPLPKIHDSRLIIRSFEPIPLLGGSQFSLSVSFIFCKILCWSRVDWYKRLIPGLYRWIEPKRKPEHAEMVS